MYTSSFFLLFFLVSGRRNSSEGEEQIPSQSRPGLLKIKLGKNEGVISRENSDSLGYPECFGKGVSLFQTQWYTCSTLGCFSPSVCKASFQSGNPGTEQDTPGLWSHLIRSKGPWRSSWDFKLLSSCLDANHMSKEFSLEKEVSRPHNSNSQIWVGSAE